MHFTRSFIIAAAILGASIPTGSQAQSLQGTAQVADGDSLSIAGLQVRLFGIDAPELDQQCFDNGAAVACGEMAKAKLASLIGDASLSCLRKSTDAHGRMVAVCRISGVDIGQAMVEAGWATAYRQYSEDYVAAEQRARASKSGLWQWEFQKPEQYRIAQQSKEEPQREARPPASTSSSLRRWQDQGQCLIKGNHSRRGEWIYHLPGMPYYNATRPEAWFCTEEEAQAAGYRRAIVR
ncbi:thermonuclease family protein [Altererythrobacter sp. BO-6]|uniref:thermonuclease family protein n=1 Tax=Altererythrobacter sp. BO-6 TaxID=2604537 RepID=UPI0019D18B93|nr:thermonuclease family protein [Altererythrobacter sp. BO-6]